MSNLPEGPIPEPLQTKREQRVQGYNEAVTLLVVCGCSWLGIFVVVLVAVMR